MQGDDRWRRLFIGALALLLASYSFAPAHAVAPFKREFEAVYVSHLDGSNTSARLVRAVQAAQCNVCHVKGKTKEALNAYGQALDRLLDHERDKQDRAKIRSALAIVDQMQIDPTDRKSITFGQRLASGLLPDPAGAPQ